MHNELNILCSISIFNYFSYFFQLSLYINYPIEQDKLNSQDSMIEGFVKTCQREIRVLNGTKELNVLQLPPGGVKSAGNFTIFISAPA